MKCPSLYTIALLAVAAWPQPSIALFRDEVGDVDFHHRLIGLPDASSTYFLNPHNQKLLVTLSDLGIVGVVSPADGSLFWRRELSVDGPANNTRLVTAKGGEWLVTTHGAEIAVWDTVSGRKIWAYEQTNAHVIDAISDIPATNAGAVFALLKQDDHAYFAIRLNSADGSLVSKTVIETKHTPRRITTIDNKAYVIAISETTVEVIVVDGDSGSTTETMSLSSKGDGNPRLLYVGGESTAPVLVWSHGGASKLFVNHLGTYAKTDITLPATVLQAEIHATTDATGKAYLVIHTRSQSGNSAVVYGVDGNAVNKRFDLPSLAGRGTFDAVSVDGTPYIVRFTDKEAQILGIDSADPLNTWPIKLHSEKIIVYSSSDVIKAEGGLVLNTAAVTNVQDWSFLQDGNEIWMRNEGLSSSVTATLISNSKPVDILKVLDEEAHSNPVSAYIHRVCRHLEELQGLPAYLLALPAKLTEAVYGGKSTVNTAFGFSKTLVVATARGRIYALDTGSQGRILWSKQIVPYVPGHQTWEVTGLYYDESEGEIIVVDKTGRQVSVSSTTGEPFRVVPPSGSTLLQSSVYDLNSSSVIPVLEGGSVVVPLAVTLDATFVVRGPEGGVQGVVVSEDGSNTVTWSFVPPTGSFVVGIYSRPTHDPVASIGRVLGDRSVLYKYLQTNTALVVFYTEEQSALTVVLLDTVSGQALHSASHAGVDITKDIDCAVSENWFTCLFFAKYIVNDGSTRTLTGQHLVMTDLYESSTRNDRGAYASDDIASSLSPISIPHAVSLPFAVSQAFILSTPLKSLCISQTMQGISRRQLLGFSPELHAVFGLPRELFDPRRPVGRDPTKDEMESESLPRYVANVELDPKLTLSHGRDIIGIQKIIAVPSDMESTSLVVAYGIDIFGTRIAPSMAFDILGKSFDRVSLIGTCLALFSAVIVLKPMVIGKQIDSVWRL